LNFCPPTPVILSEKLPKAWFNFLSPNIFDKFCDKDGASLSIRDFAALVVLDRLSIDALFLFKYSSTTAFPLGALPAPAFPPPLPGLLPFLVSVVFVLRVFPSWDMDGTNYFSIVFFKSYRLSYKSFVDISRVPIEFFRSCNSLSILELSLLFLAIYFIFAFILYKY
jgi:hypothetical protein